MENMYKEEERTSWSEKDFPKQKEEVHTHSFKFRCKPNIRKFSLSCGSSTTVQQRLREDFYFKALCCKFKEKKEVIIQRDQMPRGAVSPDFPCCLINQDELLDITFVKTKETCSSEKPKLHTPMLIHSAEDLVTFSIKTRGDENIRQLLRNNTLRRRVDYLCVYAKKGEKVKAALRRDGRFLGRVTKFGALADEEEPENITTMSNLVDHLNGKQFIVIHLNQEGESQGSSLDVSQENYTAQSQAQKVSGTSLSDEPSNVQQKEQENPGDKKTNKKTLQLRNISNSHEVLELLRKQYEGLVETMKEREKLKKKSEVQKFFLEEYDKNVQSFSEISRVRQLLERSDSVCQIRENGSSRGSGFVLFDRFIITNAHVVKVNSFTKNLQYRTTAVFYYEEQDQKREKTFSVKEEFVVHFYDKDEQGIHLDFALLELETNDEKVPPALLLHYGAPPSKGGVCIIGHPDGGVKRMDPCFLIPKGEEGAAVDTHVRENLEYLHVMNSMSIRETWELHSSHIKYNSCFFHGSSGSPVFDEHCYLIGIHTAGYVYPGKAGRTRSVMEYALPMFPVLVYIYQHCFLTGGRTSSRT